ncbi:MarR family transcriptional regulator [Ktedonosporobacter rubrisoli]|uniref:MarR family transcriptional regulator n=1 Tax=Ktedonosporobacter rubrisoli TaxID=2509675 RepID=A0A4P6JN67_KTERU|nr:MarR family transcriptional regulator [Ktedonosporobacter rubrisoli]QBD76738.1 MarR family transcriptional regulator [Ktedonosporobacter rubrisoli]
MNCPEMPALLVIKLAHSIALDMERRLKNYGVTMPQWTLLKQLWQQEGRSQVELQELLGLDKATITGLVQRMSQMELIQRRTDPLDKRVQRVFLTAQGRALEQITTALVEEVNAHALADFSADERDFFLRLLARAFYNSAER